MKQYFTRLTQQQGQWVGLICRYLEPGESRLMIGRYLAPYGSRKLVKRALRHEVRRLRRLGFCVRRG